MNNRIRKMDWQKQALTELFKNLNGGITSEVREKAVKITGLKWSKIYKWLFD
jgi:hypothetical protein